MILCALFGNRVLHVVATRVCNLVKRHFILPLHARYKHTMCNTYLIFLYFLKNKLVNRLVILPIAPRHARPRSINYAILARAFRQEFNARGKSYAFAAFERFDCTFSLMDILDFYAFIIFLVLLFYIYIFYYIYLSIYKLLCIEI